MTLTWRRGLLRGLYHADAAGVRWTVYRRSRRGPWSVMAARQGRVIDRWIGGSFEGAKALASRLADEMSPPVVS